jgi:hypothetical protein
MGSGCCLLEGHSSHPVNSWEEGPCRAVIVAQDRHAVENSGRLVTQSEHEGTARGGNGRNTDGPQGSAQRPTFWRPFAPCFDSARDGQPVYLRTSKPSSCFSRQISKRSNLARAR